MDSDDEDDNVDVSEFNIKIFPIIFKDLCLYVYILLSFFTIS